MAARILLVDNDHELLGTLKARFEGYDYEVVTAGDAATGLKEMNRAVPDIIVLDSNIPAMEGFGIFKEIKKSSSDLKVPILVFTVKGENRDMFEILDTAGFVSGAYAFDQLMLRIGEMLLKKKSQEE